MLMKKLYLMRHAESAWGTTSLADFERKLNRRGERDAPCMGRFLQERGVLLDAILCSAAERAKATAAGFLQKYAFDGVVHYKDELYHASYEIYLALLNKLPNSIEAAMIIAHNPALEDFLEAVCNVKVHISAASVADIEFQIEQWSDLSIAANGELLNLWKPREI
jgi:phosphohistidine phosphatase